MDDHQVTLDVHNAIAAALLKHERAMLGPWVLTAATTTEEGGRGVWVLTGEDVLDYEAKGLLTDALDRVRDDTSLFAHYDDDEDET